MVNPAASFRAMAGQVITQTKIAITAALQQLGADIVADLKAACPVVSGTLRNSIQFEVIEKDGDPALMIHIGGELAYYAPFVEYGTARIQKHPFVRPVMAKYKRRINDVIAGKIETALGNRGASEA